MGDSRRFTLFASLIDSLGFDKELKIADVASGKGYLQAALHEKGYKEIVSFDKRNKNAKRRKGYRYGYFDCNIQEKFDLVVAMHPDEGTDQVIMYAIKNKTVAIVCPCCTKPSAVAYWGNYSYSNWMEHLKGLCKQYGAHVTEKMLPMVGRNLVLIITH